MCISISFYFYYYFIIFYSCMVEWLLAWDNGALGDKYMPGRRFSTVSRV